MDRVSGVVLVPSPSLLFGNFPFHATPVAAILSVVFDRLNARSLSMTSAAASISRPHSTSNSTTNSDSFQQPAIVNFAIRLQEHSSTSNSKNKQFEGRGNRRGFHTSSKTFADQAQRNQAASNEQFNCPVAQLQRSLTTASAVLQLQRVFSFSSNASSAQLQQHFSLISSAVPAQPQQNFSFSFHAVSASAPMQFPHSTPRPPRSQLQDCVCALATISISAYALYPCFPIGLSSCSVAIDLTTQRSSSNQRFIDNDNSASSICICFGNAAATVIALTPAKHHSSTTHHTSAASQHLSSTTSPHHNYFILPLLSHSGAINEP